MERVQLITRLSELLRKCLLDHMIQILPDSDIVNDLGLDSMGTVEFIMLIEDEYSIDVHEQEIKDIRTLNSAADMVINKLADA